MDGVGRVFGEDGEAVGTDGARTRQRDSLFMTARLSLATSATVHEVRVRNLSAGGLMIEFDRAVEPGASVTLTMRGLGEVTGTVAWSTRGRVGIALDTQIDPRKARKPVGNGTATPGYAKAPPPLQVPRR